MGTTSKVIPGPWGDVTLNCIGCGREAVLQQVVPPPGFTARFVSIENIVGWTAPPLKCPDCS